MTEQQFLPFSRPTISEDAIAEVVDTLRSGWLTTGPKVKRLEEMLSEYHGGRHVLCVSSATAGLHLALLSLGLKEGDEVITTPLTFVATLNTIVQAGGKPVLADIDPNTLNINPASIEAAINERTRAIVPVHYAGLPCDMDIIYELAGKHGLRVIEDSAHAIGAAYKGQRLGSFGDIQVVSFHPNKNMTTGEGGAIITSDPALLYVMERMRFHGIDRNAFNRSSKGGSQQYDVVMPGFKYNMMDIQAALGMHQLPELSGFIEKRGILARRYLEILGDWDEFTLPQSPEYEHTHAWHLFTVRLKQNVAGLDRDAFINAMNAENIGIGLHYRSVHTFTYYSQKYGWKPDDFPSSLQAGGSILSLPLFPTMTIEEQDRVIKSLAKVLKKG